MTVSHDADHFRHLYMRNPDPWDFRTSPYEQAKYRNSLSALGQRRFRSGFEPGCSIGVLTRMLASSCDSLLATDIVEEPLQTARAACADLPWIRFARLRIPDEWPHGRFDLIVLSEVLYFLSPSDIAKVAAHVAATLDDDGVILSVNWRGRGDDPCSGEEAADRWIDQTDSFLRVASCRSTALYRMELLARR